MLCIVNTIFIEYCILPILSLLRKLLLNPTSIGLIVFGLLLFGNYYQHVQLNNIKRELSTKKQEYDQLVMDHAHSLDVIQQNDKDCQDLLEKAKSRTITVVKHKKQLIESKNVDLDYIIPDDYITTMNETLSK